MIILTPDQPVAPPSSLTALDQWVTWKPVIDRKNPEGKPKKLLFQVDLDYAVDPRKGRIVPAKSNDPATWAGYDEAVSASQQRHHAGVGFVFSEDDPFVGIDLDGCRDPETGEIAAWAVPWLERLIPVGYCEVSPSLTGVKIILVGTIPHALTKKKLFGEHHGFEIYSWGRYFTVTGLAVAGCAEEPGDGQAILDELFATYAPKEEAPALPAPAPPAAIAPASPASGWRADRARAVETKLRAWVEDCRAWARAQMAGAVAGGLHNRRLELGKFLGGVVAAAPHLLSEDEALSDLYGAKLPESHHSQELRAIRDGLHTGMGLPLVPGAVGDEDGRDFLPTDDDPVMRGGQPHCPRCGKRIYRSRHPYVDQGPGWYCGACRYPMVWPLAAVVGRSDTVHGVVEPADGAPSAATIPAGEGRFRFLFGAEIDQIRMPRWLVRGYLALGSVTVVYGPSESGKTPLMIDIVERVACHHPVLYVAAEDAAGLRARMRAWELHHRAQRGKIIVMPEGLPLADDDAVEAFIVQALAYGVRLVVIDTLNPCIIGLDENSNSDMGAVAVRLIRIAERLDAAVCVLHHPTKDGATIRGASALLNNTSAIWNVEKGGDDLITVKQTRNKQGGDRADRTFRIMERPIDMVDDRGQQMTSVVLLPASRMTRDHEITQKERELLSVIADSEDAGNALSATGLLEAAGYAKSQQQTFYRMLKHLKQCDYVNKGDSQRSPYTITGAGRRALAATPEDRRRGHAPGDSPWDIALDLSAQATTTAPPPDDAYQAVDGYGSDAPEPAPGGAEPEPGGGREDAIEMVHRLRMRHVAAAD